MQTAITAGFYGQAILARFMIATPPDPVKILFFNSIVEKSGQNRYRAALQVAFTVGIILAVAVLVGKALLEAMGINLGAFGIVGGVVVAGMGFEMLYGGQPSKTQGQDAEEGGPEEGSSLLMPLSTPLLAGPGAITTAITIAAANESWEASFVGLIAVGVLMIAIVISFTVLGGLIAKMSDQATAILMRFGGLLLATIGLQLALSGIRTFYEF